MQCFDDIHTYTYDKTRNEQITTRFTTKIAYVNLNVLVVLLLTLGSIVLGGLGLTGQGEIGEIEFAALGISTN